MCDIQISARGTKMTDALRAHVLDKVGSALKVTRMEPSSVEVVCRFDAGRVESLRNTCEITVVMHRAVVRVAEVDSDMYRAVETAAKKVSRQLRKYKTKVADKYKRDRHETGRAELERRPQSDVDLLASQENVSEYDLVRVKDVQLEGMSVDDAMVACDLLGHDFYLFVDSATGCTSVLYHREDGGYGMLRGV